MNTADVFQSEPGNLQKKFALSLDVHEIGELGYEVSCPLAYTLTLTSLSPQTLVVALQWGVGGGGWSSSAADWPHVTLAVAFSA